MNAGPCVNTEAPEYHPTLDWPRKPLIFVRSDPVTGGDFYEMKLPRLSPGSDGVTSLNDKETSPSGRASHLDEATIAEALEAEFVGSGRIGGSARLQLLWYPSRVWTGLFREALGELLLEDGGLRLLVINAEQEVIERWIPSTPGATRSNES